MMSRMNGIRRTTKRVVDSLSPVSIIRAKNNRRITVNFAEKIGLVYFGFVDQRADEHRLVRGLTLSPTHRDNHYCIGSISGYDMVLVERHDTITFPGKATRSVTWLILEIDLHTRRDLPHVFLGTTTHSETFYAHLFATFGRLRKLPLGVFGEHDEVFANYYNVYAEPANALDVERLFNSEITSMIGKHFRPLDIEIKGDSLFIYADNQSTTHQLLDTMVKNGLWLAQQLDAQDNPAQ